jgi:hypothetical protein
VEVAAGVVVPFIGLERGGEAASRRGNGRRAVEFYSISFRSRKVGREGGEALSWWRK